MYYPCCIPYSVTTSFWIDKVAAQRWLVTGDWGLVTIVCQLDDSSNAIHNFDVIRTVATVI